MSHVCPSATRRSRHLFDGYSNNGLFPGDHSWTVFVFNRCNNSLGNVTVYATLVATARMDSPGDHSWTVYLFSGYNKNEDGDYSWTYLFNNYSYEVYHIICSKCHQLFMYTAAFPAEHMVCWISVEHLWQCVCRSASACQLSSCVVCVCTLTVVWDPYIRCSLCVV